MSKDKISDYSATANSNTDIAGINIDEGCAPSGINNAIRTLMKQLKDFQQGTNSDPFNGPVNGTVGATTPSTGAFTSLSDSGNLTFTGTGNRITGDFSNATIANRVMFQTSTSNSATTVFSIPNGTSTTAAFIANNNSSDPANGSEGSIQVSNTEVRVSSSKRGTGADLPLVFYTVGSERMRIDTSGNLGIGVTPSAWGSGFSAMDLGGNSRISGNSSMLVANNAYFNGTNWIYKNTASAAYYSISNSGVHSWSYAASGTAGTTATFTQAMTLDASGNLLVGTTDAGTTTGIGVKTLYSATQPTVVTVGSGSTSAGNSAYVLYSTGAAALRFYVGYDGVIHATSTSISAISDATLKTNVKDLETGLTQVMALKPRRFDWVNGDATNVAGFIAQEVEEVLPELVSDAKYSYDEEGNEIYKKNLKMGDILPTLVKAIQEQQAIITTLTERITALETK